VGGAADGGGAGRPRRRQRGAARDDYEQRYIEAWRSFLGDLAVQTPTNLKEAVDLYAELQKPEWPYLRILRALEDHNPVEEGRQRDGEQEAAADRQIGSSTRKLTSKSKGLKFNVNVSPSRPRQPRARSVQEDRGLPACPRTPPRGR